MELTGAQASPLAMSVARKWRSGRNQVDFMKGFTPLKNAAFASEDACAPVG
ncbi:MAG TPA: hypothetical protein PKE69_21105 [Pyrinomonadaceae bacterium]|nr:hypothetical protein [Pyrinomonadaceae bacterium]